MKIGSRRLDRNALREILGRFLLHFGTRSGKMKETTVREVPEMDKALSAGDTLTVLSDGAALLSTPSQFEHIYKIYWKE